MRRLVPLVAVAALFAARDGHGSADHHARYAGSVEARLAAIEKTEGLLDEKIASRKEQLAARVRGFYKLSRGSSARLWIDARRRRDVIRGTSAASRIIRREATELELIQREMDSAVSARRLLETERGADIAAIPPRSLFRPIVAGTIAARFGEYRDRASRARLVRRGIEMATHGGRNVRAVAEGKVVYIGPIRGVGTGVVVSHTGGYLSVLGRVAAPRLSAGQAVDRGQVVAEAAGDRVYLEIRLLAGPGGFPIDPAPLLAAR